MPQDRDARFRFRQETPYQPRLCPSSPWRKRQNGRKIPAARPLSRIGQISPPTFRDTPGKCNKRCEPWTPCRPAWELCGSRRLPTHQNSTALTEAVSTTTRTASVAALARRYPSAAPLVFLPQGRTSAHLLHGNSSRVFPHPFPWSARERHPLVGLLVAMSIIYVPTESFKEWVKELTPQFGFVVAIGAKIQFVPLKVFN